MGISSLEDYSPKMSSLSTCQNKCFVHPITLVQENSNSNQIFYPRMSVILILHLSQNHTFKCILILWENGHEVSGDKIFPPLFHSIHIKGE
jgi:hypothetical protein